MTPGMCVSDAQVSSENGQWELAAGGTLNLRIVKVSIITLALPYFSYDKLYRVVS